MSDEREQILAEELEVLESIYPDELEKISPTHLALLIEPEVPVTAEPLTLRFSVQYPEDYPEVLPEMELEPVEGEWENDEHAEMMADLKSVGEESIGMAMVFTLASHLRESMSALVARRVVDKQRAEDEKHRQEEEAQAERMRGTAVTRESFLEWRQKFQAELKIKKDKEEEEKIKTMPPKEREEYKRSKFKLTGKQLFQTDKSLWKSDALLADDEGAVEVDFSQYSREARANDDDKEEDTGVMYDSD